jgi:ferrochelatase
MKNRIAVVLFNLGGPDSLAAVQPFLFNLFSDPDIFRLPLAGLTQKPFAALLSRRRAPEATLGYAAIGGASPLLANTRRQADSLAQALQADGEFTVHICMRYWHPRAAEVVARLKADGVARVVLLPLYPQYSRTTTGSSVNEFERECECQHYRPARTLVREWYDQPDYIEAIVQTLHQQAAQFPDPTRIELLFSAHGLPQKIVAAGDPYEQQIRATYEAVRTRLGWPRTTLCYQSRVGPLEWLRPYTDEVIRDKARAGAKQVLVYPIAFVSDHVETLYELGQTYAQLARAEGVTHYRVAPALNDHPLLIRGLRRLVMDAVTRL